MKILAIDKLKDGVTRENLNPFMKKELLCSWELYKSGKIREMYNIGGVSSVAFIFDCESIEEAQQLTNELPMVKASLIEFSFLSLEPFTDWEELWNK